MVETDEGQSSERSNVWPSFLVYCYPSPFACFIHPSIFEIHLQRMYRTEFIVANNQQRKERGRDDDH